MIADGTPVVVRARYVRDWRYWMQAAAFFGVVASVGLLVGAVSRIGFFAVAGLGAVSYVWLAFGPEAVKVTDGDQ